MKRLLSLWVLVAAVAALALWQARRRTGEARADDGWDCFV